MEKIIIKIIPINNLFISSFVKLFDIPKYIKKSKNENALITIDK
jgi:hypothetical protein